MRTRVKQIMTPMRIEATMVAMETMMKMALVELFESVQKFEEHLGQ